MPEENQTKTPKERSPRYGTRASAGPQAQNREGEVQDDQQEDDEKRPDETAGETRGLAGLLSPIGLIAVSIAAIVDIIGLVILCFGLDDLGIMDIIGLIFVGSLMLVSSGSITSTSGAQKTAKKIGTKIFKRLGLSFLGELIPYFGGAAPCWTLAVYFHFRSL
jgi:hypothetical protein